MRMDAHHFIAAAFQGDFVHAVIDVTEVQVEGFRQALQLVGDLEELRVFVLRHAVDVERRNFHQLAQGLGGGLGVFQPRINAQQAIDFVLLLGAQGLCSRKR